MAKKKSASKKVSTKVKDVKELSKAQMAKIKGGAKLMVLAVQ
jgi:bacteriocin-like protein